METFPLRDKGSQGHPRAVQCGSDTGLPQTALEDITTQRLEGGEKGQAWSEGSKPIPGPRPWLS